MDDGMTPEQIRALDDILLPIQAVFGGDYGTFPFLRTMSNLKVMLQLYGGQDTEGSNIHAKAHRYIDAFRTVAHFCSVMARKELANERA